MRRSKEWLMFLGVVIIIGSLVGPVPRSVVFAQDTLHYNDGVIAIDYPAAWQVSAFGDFEYRGVIFAPETIAVDDPADVWENEDFTQALMEGTPLFGVWMAPATEVEGSPREVMDEVLDDLNVLRTEKAGPLTIGDANGVEVIGTLDLDAIIAEAHLALLVGQGRFYFVFGITAESSFEEHRATFEQAFGSLQFVDADHLPTPLPIASDVEYTTYTGAGFSLLQPSTWQGEAIETFDGSLTVFCTPPAEPTQPYNRDLALIDEFLATGTWSEMVSAELMSCVVDRTVVGVITIPVALLEDATNPAQAVLQRVLTSGVVSQIQQTRLVNVQNHVGAEMVAVVSGIEPVATAPYVVYSLAIEHEEWVVIVAASSPLADYGPNEAIFRTMAYSLNVEDLPQYSDYGGIDGGVISYGAAVDGEMVVGAIDEWRFYGEAGDYVTIGVTSDAFDTVLELDDAEGRYLADNDDYDGSNSFIGYTLPNSGYYIIKVAAYSNSGEGPYRLTLNLGEVIVN